MLKKVGFSIASIVLFCGVFIAWFFSLIDRSAAATGWEALTPDQIPYLQDGVRQKRGRILAVVTSETTMGEGGKKTGYEHTELARAYYVFQANGFEVEIASPKGGAPRAIIDDEDMGQLDFAFLNDARAQEKVADTLPIASVDGDDYEAVYFVGGKGTMWDFPDNAAIQHLVASFAEQNKVIGAVCHGPAALVNVELPGGGYFLQGRRATSFTNDEELFLIPNAREVFPFLLEDRMTQRGATVNNGPNYLENIVVDGNLVTGQNPWSVYATAESMLSKMGYSPLPRQVTGDENSVEVLLRFHQLGGSAARAAIDDLLAGGEPISRNLLLMHGLLAGMNWQPVRAVQLVLLAQHLKSGLEA